MRKSLEAKKKLGEKAAQQEGCCSHWCSVKQKEGRKRRREWRLRMVRSRDLVVFRGVNVGCVVGSKGVGGDGNWKALPGGFHPHLENGVKVAPELG